ncbi:hypothetical protein A9Z42_0034060 [Trichoderma parareesei]|uniref:Uncharacterized protein n=1 Tax=Trichoderma parareesei TaxID=858221 RepID=A0A2H2ZDI5_TRIPA|nr:hypothetical protein A9Z42_0034060 [Trichoderma parareesei]
MSPGERFAREFCALFDSLESITTRPLALSRLIYTTTERATQATRIERRISNLIEHDERREGGALQIYFASVLRVTGHDGIVIELSQEITMLASPTNTSIDDLRLEEMRTSTWLVEAYPEGDEVGEPMTVDDL